MSLEIVNELFSGISALATLGAAVAAGVSAKKAADSAEFSKKQVEIQRSKPLVVIERGSNGFIARNIGNSPAFDVALTPIKVDPKRALNIGGPQYLITTVPIRFVRMEAAEVFGHWKNNEVQLDNLDTFFNSVAEEMIAQGFEKGCIVPIPFTLSYAGLDGTHFECPCAVSMCLFTEDKLTVGPVRSWLPEIVEPPKR